MELYLKPAPGLVIKKPDGSKLAADGEKVPRTSFWLKRLADGDVLPVEEEQADQDDGDELPAEEEQAAQADKKDVKPAAKATKKPQAKE